MWSWWTRAVSTNDDVGTDMEQLRARLPAGGENQLRATASSDRSSVVVLGAGTPELEVTTCSNHANESHTRMTEASLRSTTHRKATAGNERRLGSRLIPHLGLLILISAFVAASLVVVDSSAAPIVDEPIFAASALEFAQSGDIQISNLSAPNAVFDTVWGGLFARAFGMSYESLRFSTILLSALSAPFMYLFCRSLGGDSALSLFGAALYLFAPLAFALSVTFQTDAHFLALMVMAISLMSYAMSRDNRQPLFLFAGSVFTALAFLSRPQALIVVIAAVAVFLLRTSRVADFVRNFLAIAVVPTATFVVHDLWTDSVGVPYIRDFSIEFLRALDFGSYSAIGAQALIGAVLYVGLFSLPLAPLLIPSAIEATVRRQRVAVYLGTAILALAAGSVLSGQGPLYHQSWVSGTGLGAVDRSLLGSRPGLASWIASTLTAAFAVSVYALLLALIHKRRSKTSAARDLAIFTAMGFAGNAFISTLGGHPRIHDRYWLPLVPLAIALGVSVSQTTTKRMWLASSLGLVMSVIAVVGTSDAFHAYDAANDFANEAVEQGISPLALDGGASWSASTFGLHDDDPAHLDRPGPFWIKFYAVESDPEYGISLEPLEGYAVLARKEYRSILHPGPNHLYLLHRDSSLPFYIDVDDL